MMYREAYGVKLFVVQTLQAITACNFGQNFCVVAFFHPCGALTRQTLVDVVVIVRVGVEAGGVV